MSSETIELANAIVESFGHLIAPMKSKDIYEMINEFEKAEGMSVVFDAVELQGTQKFYTEGRNNFYKSISFKKKFLEHLVEIVKFMEEERKKFQKKPLMRPCKFCKELFSIRSWDCKKFCSDPCRWKQQRKDRMEVVMVRMAKK